jgi:4-aminobutyrate aminotransferase-like enzyme
MFAAALINLAVIERLNLQQRAEQIGHYVTQRLREMQEQHDLIGDVRGPGLFIGIEFVRNRKTKEPADSEAKKFLDYALRHRVLFEVSMPTIIDGREAFTNVVKIKPPLTITTEQVERMLEVIEAGIQFVEPS